MKITRASDSNFREVWNKLAGQSEIFSPLATETDILFQRAYLASEIAEEHDVSIVVSADSGEPLCGFRAFLLRSPSGESRLSCMGRPLAYVQASPGHRESQAAFKRIKEEIEALLAGETKPEVWFRDILLDGSLSDLALHFLGFGARLKPALTQIIDLTPSEDELRSGVRSSFRSLINWGLRELGLRVVDSKSADRAAFDEFRALHKLAAGRDTRSAESWDRQCDSIAAGEMFLVAGYLDGRMVTGGLFKLGRKYCYYGIGASDRDLFDKPLSHAVIWKAMLHAKSIGIQHFEMGEQVFPSFPEGHVSEKEVSIAMFKRGFGGSTKSIVDLYYKRA